MGGREGRESEVKIAKMAVCTLVKLEAYRERGGSRMRAVATETEGRVRAIMGWRRL